MLTPIANEIWGITAEARLMPAFYLPIRCVVIRLDDGGLLIHSPLRFDEDTVREIEALGPVRYIVSPNAFHHLFAKAAIKRWPAASYFASSALKTKRPDLRPEGFLGDETQPLRFAAEVYALPVDGQPKIAEWVFFHRASRTLICTDMVFCILKTRGFLARLYLRLAGAYGLLAQTRLVSLFTSDRSAAARSYEAVLELDFVRVVPAHGEVVVEDGSGPVKPRIRHALRRYFSQAA